MSKELLELMQKTRVRKYHKSDPRKLINGMTTEIRMKSHYGSFRSWELMVEHLARWLVLNKKVGFACSPPLEGFKGLSLKKDAIYEHLESLDLFQHYYTAAMAKPWDYIGQVYAMDLELTGPGQDMTPRPIVEFMTQLTYTRETSNLILKDGDLAWQCFFSYQAYKLWYTLMYHVPPRHLRPMEIPIKTQLDPCVGTGRFLIVASQMFPKANLVLFGIEINLALYRACLVNMAMFSNHPYSIICADTLRIDQDKSGTTSKLWDLGNQWNPPDMSSFYWKPPPIWHDRFSLKAYTELNEEEKK